MAPLLFLLPATPCLGDEPDPIPVRVGLVAFEDFYLEYAKWRDIFAAWEKKADPPLEFEIAVGTHSEMLHWMENQWLDVVILPPATFAMTMDLEKGGATGSGFTYLATVGYPPSTSAFAEEDRRKPGVHFTGRPVCVVSADSALQSVDDLTKAAKAGKLKFLFVNPLSTTGGLAPLHALGQAGLKLLPDQVEYTYSHTLSLQLLSQAKGEEESVAFVWDDSLRTAPQLTDSVRRIKFPALDRLLMPMDVMLVRQGFDQRPSLEKLASEQRDPEGNALFTRLKDWQKAYGDIRQWGLADGAEKNSTSARQLSLDELGWILLHSARSQGKPPRLALVFSGGGAKCSYQVGAVSALEEKLAELRKKYPAQSQSQSLDIQLVVGTSGGAINAVPVAMGVSRTPAGQKDMSNAWARIDQRVILRPPMLSRFLLGLWFALLQFGLIVWLTRKLVSKPVMHGWVVCGALAASGLMQILAFSLDWSPYGMLGTNHVWHHLWLLIGFGSRASAWPILVIGLLGLVGQYVMIRKGKDGMPLPPRWFGWLQGIMLVGLPFAVVISVLFVHDTLSSGLGIEETFADCFEEIVANDVRREHGTPLQVDDDAPARDRLQSLSKAIFERGLIRRDLVVTGTCLARSDESIPEDLYLFAQRDPALPAPPFGERGVRLNDRQVQSQLLDVVMGSGTIFPIFPARRIRDFPDPGQQVDLVDGGFAHNSPIEAAVLWGATHVIVIEASPEAHGKHHNFVGNLGAAFAHLHRQTQQIDLRSKREVRVFTLAPAPPHMCLLDFADNLIEASIERGYREVKGETATGRPFAESLGRPVFQEVKPGDE